MEMTKIETDDDEEEGFTILPHLCHFHLFNLASELAHKFYAWIALAAHGAYYSAVYLEGHGFYSAMGLVMLLVVFAGLCIGAKE